MRSCWHGIFGENFINAIVPRNCAPKTCQAVCKCIALLAGSKAKRAELLARVFQDKFHQCDCAEKLCAQDLSSGVQTLGDGTCIARWQGARLKEQSCRHGVFQDKFHQRDCPEKLCARDLSNGFFKRCATGHAWENVRCWRVFILHGVLSIDESSSLPSQGSKLNKNRSIGDASA